MVVQAPVDHPKELITVLGEIGTHALAVGVRRNLQDEQPGFLHARGLRDGVRALAEFGLPFDACVRSRQLGELDDLAAAARETVIVLNHLGKPRCGDDVARWRKALYGLAARPNLRCKLSGLSTEAAPAAKHADLIAALRTALDAFGADRCLYGGDWPISTRAISGQGWLSLVLQCLEEMGASSTEREDVLSRTAKRTYRFAEQEQVAP